MEIVKTCPLGSQCEEIKDGKIHQCHWWTKVVGKNPQSHEELDEYRCAIAWMPVLQIEMSQTNRGQTQAISSFRDEMVESNKKSMALNSQLLVAKITGVQNGTD
jgi:hypothetical protein